MAGIRNLLKTFVLALSMTPVVLSAAEIPLTEKVESVISSEETGTLAIGFGIGLASGNGFNFRYMPAHTGFGFNAATIFWVAGESGFFNLGFSPLIVLKQTRNTALYLIPFSISFYAGDGGSSYAAGMGLGISKLTTMNNWTAFELVITAFEDFIIPLPQASFHYYIK